MQRNFLALLGVLGLLTFGLAACGDSRGERAVTGGLLGGGGGYLLGGTKGAIIGGAGGAAVGAITGDGDDDD